jgi:hypothetical protein
MKPNDIKYQNIVFEFGLLSEIAEPVFKKKNIFSISYKEANTKEIIKQYEKAKNFIRQYDKINKRQEFIDTLIKIGKIIGQNL